jgi:hypothetical protein
VPRGWRETDAERGSDRQRVALASDGDALGVPRATEASLRVGRLAASTRHRSGERPELDTLTGTERTPASSEAKSDRSQPTEWR